MYNISIKEEDNLLRKYAFSFNNRNTQFSGLRHLSFHVKIAEIDLRVSLREINEFCQVDLKSLRAV